jgi:hypothetical protein
MALVCHCLATSTGLNHCDGNAGRPGPGTTVKVQTIKYDKLCDLIDKHKGKVVLVDLWNTG